MSASVDVRQRVLAAVREERIGRNRRGHQWWLNDEHCRTLTTAELRHLRALVESGVVRFETAGGYRNGTPIGLYHYARADR